MPYIYSIFQIEWSADFTKYKKHLTCSGTEDELVSEGKYCSTKNVRQLFAENIRQRMDGSTTKHVWEREWKPEPGEKKPKANLPDKLDAVYPPSKYGARSRKKYDSIDGPEREYKPPKSSNQSLLEKDIHQLVEDNHARAMRGKPPLSYGRWRAGLR